jgi:hypothetical protein
MYVLSREGVGSGAWRSLVAHLLWEQGVASSNLAAPTIAAELWRRKIMVARIYKPAKTAMQQGKAGTRDWVLVYEPQSPRVIEPLMGWTSSDDTRSQICMRFESLDEAVAYATRHGIPFRIDEPAKTELKPKSYAENFKYGRVGLWTH